MIDLRYTAALKKTLIQRVNWGIKTQSVKPYFKILHGNAISAMAVATIIHGKYDGRHFSSKKDIIQI